MNTDTVLTIGLLIAGYALISGKVKHSFITPAMAFVAVGLLIGPDVLDIVTPRVDEHDFEGLAELALTLILFLQASRLNVGEVWRDQKLPKRLVTVGLPVSMGIGTLVALLVFPELPFWEAAILAIIVAPTEAALIEPVIDKRQVPGSVRRALSVESGLSDGVALALLLIALAFASEETEGGAGDWISIVGKSLSMSLVVGGLMGLVGGKLLDSGKKAGRVTETWSELYVIALAALTFVTVEHLDGSGFVGAFGAGLAFAVVIHGAVEKESGTADAVGELLELVVFALLGAAVVWPAFDGVDVDVLLFAVLSLVVVRMAAVALATFGLGLSRATTVYLGWFGPRGLASLLFGFLVLEEGEVSHIPLITDAVVVTVTLSIFLHGITAKWGTTRYAAVTQGLRRNKPDAPELAAAEGGVRG